MDKDLQKLLEEYARVAKGARGGGFKTKGRDSRSQALSDFETDEEDSYDMLSGASPLDTFDDSDFEQDYMSDDDGDLDEDFDDEKEDTKTERDFFQGNNEPSRF